MKRASVYRRTSAEERARPDHYSLRFQERHAHTYPRQKGRRARRGARTSGAASTRAPQGTPALVTPIRARKTGSSSTQSGRECPGRPPSCVAVIGDSLGLVTAIGSASQSSAVGGAGRRLGPEVAPPLLLGIVSPDGAVPADAGRSPGCPAPRRLCLSAGESVTVTHMAVVSVIDPGRGTSPSVGRWA